MPSESDKRSDKQREKSAGGEENGLNESSTLPTTQSDAHETGPELQEKSPKESQILDACQRRDIQALQALAESPGGFVTDEIRQRACEFVQLGPGYLMMLLR